MLLDPNALNQDKTPSRIVTVGPRPRRFGVWIALVSLLVLVAAVGAKAWESGFKIQNPWRDRPTPLALLDVDEGIIEVSVTETGNLESATNSKIKCQVESLLGNVGSGTTGGTSRPGGAGGGAGGTGGASGGGSGGGQSPNSSGATKAKSSARSKSGGASKSASSGGSSSKSAVGSTASSSTAASGSASASSSATTKKPTIRSFSYQVAKHIPLRSSTKAPSTTKSGTASASGMSGGAGGGRGGGGGGGGGRGGGGGGMSSETAGSTRIIEIVPEGTMVTAGQVVCSLDSSTFRDALQAQQIKHAQAKAWVDQARTIYEVNEITLLEYRDGILPQDIKLIEQYIESCQIESERALKAEQWSKETMAKGFRAAAQYSADEIELQRCDMALKQAKGMEERLTKYTAPRLLMSLKAKLQSIRADMLAQEASFGVEDDRLRRITRMIEHCTIRAPREGVLVYANEANPWSGRTEVQIQEGVTVREGQALFDLPDPNHMRVKVKINESKMASIRSGQKAMIHIEAFPNRPLTGIVTEITPIPAVLGRFSDVRIYFAYVQLDTGGFTGLRPGMSAQVSFFVEAKDKAIRVPVQAVRWVGDQTFTAVAAQVGDETRWQWRPITLGLMNENYAQVVKGLNPGEHVVAKPDSLPVPVIPKAPAVQTAAKVDMSTSG